MEEEEKYQLASITSGGGIGAKNTLSGKILRIARHKKIIFMFFIVGFIGVYGGILLFGKNSVEILINLERKNQDFIKKAQYLQEQNERLQKKIFELRGLRP